MTLATAHESRRPAAVPDHRPPAAADPATLVRDVHRRAAPVLALTAARAWPEAELDALTRFVRGALPRHPAGRHPQLAELVGRLERLGRSSCTPAALDELVHTLLRTIEQQVGPDRATGYAKGFLV